MIYAAYVVVASLVVWFSILASRYIDMIDRTTRLSGAFLGGVLLSAVTSLPELFTSISATVFLDQPDLCIGNILGSDLFNLGMLGVVVIFSIRLFSRAACSRSHIIVIGYLILMYAALGLRWGGVISLRIGWFDLTTLIIFTLYGLAVRHLAAENGEQPSADEQAEECSLTVGQIAARFTLASIGIIALSIALTYITDDISERLDLGAGLAGALFLGVATSLPEVTSTIALFRMRNYNIAVGNIIGSNVFNFFVLGIADFVSSGQGVYSFADSKVQLLLIFGSIATPLAAAMIMSRRPVIRLACAAGMVACYILFLSFPPFS